MRVGIPRCLGFFYLFPLYRAFLKELAVEWVESPFTAEGDLQRLDLCPTDEPCIAVKAAFSHVDRLLNTGVGALFVPTVVSLSESAFCCPKMMGLPAMLKAAFDLPDEAMISPAIDFRGDPKGWARTWVTAARQMGVGDEALARRALKKGIAAWRKHDDLCAQSGVSTLDVIEGRVGQEVRQARGHGSAGVASVSGVAGTGSSASVTVVAGVTGVMGHSYVLHDVFARKVVETVRGYGPAVTSENVDADEAKTALAGIIDGDKLWSIEGHILGSALHLIHSGEANRLIFVSAFSCGPASIIENYIANEADRYGVPLLNLTIDEHSGEAGLLTRLEAFMDSTSAAGQARAVAGQSARAGALTTVQAEPSPAPASADTSSTLGDGPLGLVDLGTLRYALRALFSEMGCELVMPPPLTEDIVRLGKEIAPEFICYPMVTLIGQMRQHAENGVRRIVMVQGKGKCRLGWYAQVMEEILRRSGYPVQVLSVDSPFPLAKRWGAFVESYRALSGGAPAIRGLRGFRMALVKIAATDRGGDILREVRAYEAERGEGDERYARFVREVDEAGSARLVWSVFGKYAKDMQAIPRVQTNPLKVSLVGEVYVVNEPFVNRDAERILGSLEQRVRVYRKLDVNSWVDYHLFKIPRAVRQHNLITRSARSYLPVDVGGHGQESVGETVLSKQNGMDGVIHLFPFTCMPEIIAQNILVKVSRDLDIPVLSLMISEQTGLAGLQTRFEAFCDLLEGRRKGRIIHED